VLLGEECFGDEEQAAEDYRGVGYVEGGPVPLAEVEEEEVDDFAVGDAVEKIAGCATKNECKCNSGSGAELAGFPDEPAENDDRDGGEGDEEERPERRWRVGKDAEGGSSISHMGNGEEARDDADSVVELKFVRDDVFGPAVESDDGSSDKEIERAVHDASIVRQDRECGK
jgi:hypothetical protein